MPIEYLGLSSINGPLIALEGMQDAFFDEIVEFVINGNERRIGRIIELYEDKAVIQVFEGSENMSLKNTHTRLTGHPVKRLPGTASFVFEGVEGEALLLHLDAKGICASSGSACSSASLDPSHVLLSIGLPHAIAHGSLRLSLGAENTEEDVDYILKEVPAVVAYLREMSPVWDKEAQKPTWEL